MSPTKTAPEAAQGGSPTTRSATENKRQAEELAKANQEIAEYERKLDLAEKKGKDSNKRVKATKYQVYAVSEKSGTWHEMEKAFKNRVWPHHKFMSCEEDEYQIMTLVLKATDDWKNMKDLSEEDLREQIAVYQKVYGTKLTTLMNTIRSTDQSAVRKRYIEDVKANKIVSAKKYLGRGHATTSRKALAFG